MRTGLSDVEPGLGIKRALPVLTLIFLLPLSTYNVPSTGLARKGFSVQSMHPTCLPQAGLHPHLALFRRHASWHDPHDPPQFSSVAQLCPTLCDPMNCSTPGLPVHHQLPEFT